MEQRTIQIGVGVNYYGSIHPEHSPCMNELLRNGIPAVQIRSCAYPEMGLAEITRMALEQQCQVVVFVGHDMLFTPADVRMIGELAAQNDAIVSASYGRPKTGASRKYSLAKPKLVELEVAAESWVPSKMAGMGFTAVPLTIIKALAESDDRVYTNSSVVDTGFSKDSRPFFSPWQKSPGTLHTVPVAHGVYTNPDTAFLLRAVRAGFKVYDCPSVNPRCLASSTYSVSIYPGDAEKRKEHGLHANYVVCVPSFGALDLDQQHDLFELTKAGVAVVDLNGCPYLDLARSELVRIARNELNADGVFFLDHDIIFRPLDLISVCNEAHARQDIVAAVYQMRGSGKNIIGAPATEVDDEITFFEGGGVIPALYSGLGFAAIPIGVFSELDKHLPALEGGMPGLVRPYFALDTNANFYSGEDVSFCGRVQGLTVRHFPTERGEDNLNGVEWEVKRCEPPTNYRVLFDTRIRIFHRGSYDYGLEDRSLVVPRYSPLIASMKATREEAKAAIKTVDQLPESDISVALEEKDT